MKRSLKVICCILLAILTHPSVFAQMHYDAGYIIDSKGKRIECFIRNEEWAGTRQECHYRLEKRGKKYSMALRDIQSFQIYGYAKHEKHVVTFARTPTKFTDIRKQPRSTDTLLLGVLIEGDPSLLVYDHEGNINFFYARPGETPVVLEYKEHLEQVTLYKYFEFWDQLKKLSAHCPDLNPDNIRQLTYTYSSLIPFFKKLNECNKVAYNDFHNKKERKLLKLGLAVTPGVSLSDAILNKYIVYYGDKVEDLSLGNKASFRLGAEIRLYSTAIKGVSVFVEPAYQHYGTSDKMTDPNHGFNLKLNYIDLGVGLRYQLDMHGALSFFANAVFVPVSFRMGPAAGYYDTYTAGKKHPIFDFKLNTNNTYAFGLGAQYNRFGLEARYYLSKSILKEAEENIWDTKVKRLSLIARFNIL